MANLYDLMVTIGADTTDAERGMSSVSKSAGGLSGKFSALAKGAVKIGSAVLEAGKVATKALFGMATDAASVTDEIDKMSQKIGMSKEAYQEFDYVAQLCGTDVNVMQAGMKSLRSAMDKANNGTEDSIALFNRLGVSLTDSEGLMKDQETVMWEVLDALQGVGDETTRATLATQLFGRAGTELMPMLNSGTGSIAEMREEAHRLGLVLSDEDIAMGVQFTDTMTRLHDVLDAVKTKVGVELIPIFENLGEFILSKMPQIQEAVGVSLNYISMVVALAWDVISDIIWALQDAFDIVSESLAENGIAWDDVWSGIYLIVKKAGDVISVTITAIAKLIAWLVTESQKDGSFINTVWKNIQAAVKTCYNIIEPLLNMIIDILNGDWHSAFENGKKVVSNVFDGIGRIINNNINFVKGILDKIVAFFTGSGAGTWSDAFAKGKQRVSEWIEDIKRWFQSIDWLGLARNIAIGVYNGLVTILNEAWTTISNTVSTWISNISNAISNIMSGSWGGNSNPTYNAGNGHVVMYNPNTGQYEYHDKATRQPYLLSSETVFGRNSSGQMMVGGETQDEIIYGRDNLMRDISQASGGTEIVNAIAGYMGQIISIMESYFPQFGAGQNIVLNNGVLVGEIARDMSNELDKINGRRYY